MKKTIAIIIATVLSLTVAITALLCLERIPAGYVGVVYSMNGGVQDDLLTQGFHFVNPTKQVKEFTIGNEQLVLTQDERDGSKGETDRGGCRGKGKPDYLRILDRRASPEDGNGGAYGARLGDCTRGWHCSNGFVKNYIHNAKKIPAPDTSRSGAHIKRDTKNQA